MESRVGVRRQPSPILTVLSEPVNKTLAILVGISSRLIAEDLQQDLDDRKEAGIKKYGTELNTFNGRDSLIDAYQESCDLCVYLTQNRLEQKNLDDPLLARAIGITMEIRDELKKREEAIGEQEKD